MVRQPAVAGEFYEGSAETLKQQVEECLDRGVAKQDVLGCVCPHAGYMFSGGVAGAVLSSINIPKRVLILSFSHRGAGARYAVWPKGPWRTPLGDVPVDECTTTKLLEDTKTLVADPEPFMYEHSGEVMLPFLQVLRPDVEVVMVSVYPASPIEDLQAIGAEIASTIGAAKTPVLVLASSDMTHHAPARHAQKMDGLAIDRMLALDEGGLLRVVMQNDISMCGVCPVVAAIACVKKLGAKTGRLVRYATSGDVTGDRSSVVGYAGVVFA